MNSSNTALASSPVKQSLLAHEITLGVDDWLLVINLELTLFIVMLLRVYSWVLVAVALHFVLVMVTRLHPKLLETYVKFVRQAGRYWPGPSPLQRRGHVPQRFLEWQQ